MRTDFRSLAPGRAIWLLMPLLLCAALLMQMGNAGAVDVERACSLTIDAGSSEFNRDLEKANAVVDLYLVAAATGEDHGIAAWRLLAPYTELKLREDMLREDWRALAQTALETAASEGVPMVKGAPLGSEITDTDGGSALTPGIYLAVVRPKNVEDPAEYMLSMSVGNGERRQSVTRVESDEFLYTFLPELVELPAFDADETNPYHRTISVKPERTARFGKLEIVKTLKGFGGTDPQVFLFDVSAMLGGRSVYSDTVTLRFRAEGEKKAVIEHIPIGATVTVKEIYSGASCVLTSAAEQTAQISLSENAQVHFTNEYREQELVGGAIVNHFEYVEPYGWEWTQQLENAAREG